jgi:hypothetical protein
VSDHPFLTRILLACSRGRTRLFRHNVGLGWVGKSWRCPSVQTVELQPGDVVIRKARPLHAGLCEGGSDLIGWTTIEHAGRRFAVFTAIEGKEGTGRLSPEQRTFLEQLRAAGGIAVEGRDEVPAVVAELERCVSDLSS